MNIRMNGTTFYRSPEGMKKTPEEAAEAVLRHRRLDPKEHLRREWRQIHMRLLGNDTELYGEIDRFESEAEFRTTLAAPVVVLGIVVAFRVDPWWAVVAVLVGAIGFAGLLGWAGGRSRQAAGLALYDAIEDERAKVPTLVRLKVAIKEIRPSKPPDDALGDEADDVVANELQAARRGTTAARTT